LPDLSEPERLVWKAFPRGAWVDLRAHDPAADDLDRLARAGPQRVVRAEVIAALLLGAGETEPGCAPGVRLRGARISGRLDLMGATVAWPLVCEFCSFDDELRFVESSVKTVRIVSSRLPGFNGTRMHLAGILNFASSVITGIVRLDQARVTGQVCLRDANVTGPAPGGAAVAAYGLVVDGDVECVGLIASGSVSLEVAAISGSLDLTGARISCAGTKALIIDNAGFGGRMQCRGMVVEGETRMHNCRVGASVVMTGARLANPAGVALSAGGLTVEGGVFLVGGFAAAGEIRMMGARLEANLSLAGASVSNPGGIAVNLNRSRIGIVNAPDATFDGEVSFTGAQIASDLKLAGARLRGGTGRPAPTMEGASVDGVLDLHRVRAEGELSLRTIRVGRRLLLMDSEMNQPDGIAFRLSRAQVTADVFCDGMTVTGCLRLAGATIGGVVTLKQVRLRNPAGVALDAKGIQAQELVLTPAAEIEGAVDLSHGRIGLLRDDPRNWPAQLSLDGLTYEMLEPWLPARQRQPWLARDPRGRKSQPYEQLAAHYTAIGEPGQARAVLYARERLQRQSMRRLARAWSTLQDVTVGYGFQPWRALAWLALLLAAGSITFALAPPPPLQAGATPHFNPFFYTLDLLLPVVNLGQKGAFNPAGAEQWLSYFLIAAGWVLVTTIAAGAARVLSRR
jgi:hypothetical protein